MIRDNLLTSKHLKFYIPYVSQSPDIKMDKDRKLKTTFYSKEDKGNLGTKFVYANFIKSN